MTENEASSSAELLAPDEAADQLDRTLKDYFGWQLRDPNTRKPLTRVLVKSPPGLGKTQTGIMRAIKYQVSQGVGDPLTFEHIVQGNWGDIGPTGTAQTVIFTARHHLAREAQALIENNYAQHGLTFPVPVLRGRTDQSEVGNAPCKRWREAEALQKNGYPVFSNLCRHGSGDGASECPYYSDCEYIRNYQEAYEAPFVIMVHSHLGLPWQPQADVLDSFKEPDDPKMRLFRPAYPTTVICDEDPSQHLVEEKRLSRSRFHELKQDGFGGLLLAGLNAAEGLLTYLSKNGLTAEKVRVIASELRDSERAGGKVVAPHATDAAIGEQLAAAPKRIILAPILDRLADELASGREGPSYSLLADGEKVIAQGRRPYPFPEARLLVLDGTADPRILNQFIPDLLMVPEIRVRRNAHVVQVRNVTFYKGSLIAGEDGHGRPKPTERLNRVAAFFETVAATGKTLVVTNKPVRCALTGENPNASLPVSAPHRKADIAHFGNIRGVNDFEDHENVIILGREELTVEDVEHRAMAIWYDTADPIERVQPDANGQRNYPKEPRSYRHLPGHSPSEPVQVSVHPDLRVQAVLEQRREAESLQAIDRLRLIHNAETKFVWILCNIPLDLPVDALTTWGALRDCSGKLGKMLKRCDEAGGNAISLAKAELAGRYPDLWPKEKDADKWLQKKPLDTCKGLIRKWGFLVEYRPQGQKSWSMAIVRQGGVDQKGAIGSALGLPSNSVVIRA